MDDLDGQGMDPSEATVEFTLNAGGLRLLLDAVTYRLERWSGGEPMSRLICNGCRCC